MKTMIRLLTCAVVAAMSTEVSKAALNIPSDGSDGALVITNDTVIDLSQAVTGNWNDNNSPNVGKGIYDSNKWAVVFKYSSVVVQGGATVTFKNHASRAPVVWLVSGDVSINGTVSVDGQSSQSVPALAEPGPGGFRGGSGAFATGAGNAAGLGPGAAGLYAGGTAGLGAAYGSVAAGYGYVYGNPSMIPLVGGSGGGGVANNWNNAQSGGAGAGAMLIAAAGSLSISGTIHAKGGNADAAIYAGAGSGGGIRLVADTLSGGGIIQAIAGFSRGNVENLGGLGRIRIERVTNTSTLTIVPDPSVVNLASGATPQIWLPTNGPTIKVLSIGGNVSPADPRAEFGAIGADIVLPQVTSTTVVVETTNVEQASVVTVRATPRSNGNYSEATATVTAVISEDPLVLRWTANVPVQNGYAAIQAKVVRP